VAALGKHYKFTVNYDKAVKIAEILQKLDRNTLENYCFELEKLRGEGIGDREIALYYTYVASVDYQTDARRLWESTCKEFLHDKKWFTPEFILRVPDEDLSKFLKKIGVRYYRKDVKTWKDISKILIDKYSGDPRKIVPKGLSVREIRERLEEFPNLRGCKISDFYIRIMHEAGFFEVEHSEELSIPVDIQVTRFTLYTGVLKLECGEFTCRKSEICKSELGEEIRKVWGDAAKSINVEPWKLDEPIWRMGSEYCSKRKILNTSDCDQKDRCPISTYCEKTTGFLFTADKIEWKSTKPC
jgi:endonuclease III